MNLLNETPDEPDDQFYIEFLQNELDDITDLLEHASPEDLRLYWIGVPEERQAILDLYEQYIEPLPDDSVTKLSIIKLFHRLGINPYKPVKINHLLESIGYK